MKQTHLERCTRAASGSSRRYEEVDLAHVRRERNIEADALVNAALDLPRANVLLWYIGLSVSSSPRSSAARGIDYRLVALGSMLPLIVDLAFGYRAYGYTLLFAVVLLAVVMLGTIGRPRLLRRRLLCLPIGVFCGLVLSGAFTNDELFWWPFLGSFPHDALLPRHGGSW